MALLHTKDLYRFTASPGNYDDDDDDDDDNDDWGSEGSSAYNHNVIAAISGMFSRI